MHCKYYFLFIYLKKKKKSFICYNLPFNFRLPAWGCRQVAKLLGVKFEIRGHENIVKDTGCIVLINHQSSFDLCGKPAALIR